MRAYWYCSQTVYVCANITATYSRYIQVNVYLPYFILLLVRIEMNFRYSGTYDEAQFLCKSTIKTERQCFTELCCPLIQSYLF